MQRAYRHFIRPTKKCAVKKVYTAKFDQDELDILIKLLEFSQMEILRTFKKFSESDFDLKEIYWNYRYNSNLLRKKLQSLKD
ncbi:hypothetical protein CLHUN_35900 [Ruminiclostridium hungatei]|uniref:Uncharacterized protein n=1 Tax=Ruminiclostridium hungatei TaxID=48256 RepID=A0A1V4SG58_RUMHU|nr:hypothetical protein CLHUN_35790 [Ruminiclostridium hungatei]OPX42465.1 hypothetical protein CLHUN_35900 [Ruminiclostridium hungatei]